MIVYDPRERALILAAVQRAQERASTVHERQPCKTCGAPKGTRCIDRRRSVLSHVHHTKHPHRARLRADGLYER